jgi:cation diffusion facilitator CzcD-associated flavoprotein CzcO
VTDYAAAVDRRVRIAIIGTGFAGLGAAIRLLDDGTEDFVLFEQAADVGGTWRDNTYPGCQCDVPSHLYSFSFAQHPEWSRTYALQSEIQDYLRACADRHGVRERIRFNHTVTDARWDDDLRCWVVTTDHGTWLADVLVTGHGGLSAPAIPDIPGLDKFGGAVFHTAAWDHGHVLAGERVAVIGTGSSAIQVVPEIQPEVARLHVFQRTPPWVLPHTDRPVTRAERWVYRRFPAAQRAMRALVYWSRELYFPAFARKSWLTDQVRRLATTHLHRQVAEPDLRARLTPDYEPGCKRLLLSNSYFPALTAPNAELVTHPITEITATSIVTADRRERPVDTIVLGTGFQVTDHPMLDVIHGRDGRSLAKVWAESGMRAYLGTTVAGFPNLFMLAGPNTGIGHTSLVFMIEAQLDYVLGALARMRRRGLASVEVRPEVLDAYNDALQDRMRDTVWSAGGCASWYLDAAGRNTTLWPDFTWKFRRRTRRFDIERYDVTLAPR